jgi:hypothetical protein
MRPTAAAQTVQGAAAGCVGGAGWHGGSLVGATPPAVSPSARSPVARAACGDLAKARIRLTIRLRSFDTRATAEHALYDLRVAEWDVKQILTFHRPTDAAVLRATEEPTWHQRLRHWWWALSTYPVAHRGSYLAEPDAGKSLLHVYCPNDEARRIAARVLVADGGSLLEMKLWWPSLPVTAPHVSACRDERIRRAGAAR